jgi:hypothetical protein
MATASTIQFDPEDLDQRAKRTAQVCPRTGLCALFLDALTASCEVVDGVEGPAARQPLRAGR